MREPALEVLSHMAKSFDYFKTQLTSFRCSWFSLILLPTFKGKWINIYYQILSFLTLLWGQAHVSQEGADTHILIFLLKTTITVFLQNPIMLKCTSLFPIYNSRPKLSSHYLLLLHTWATKILPLKTRLHSYMYVIFQA